MNAWCAHTAPGGAAAERSYWCERCGSEMIEHHCKIRCPNCGYVRDCSDPRSEPFPLTAAPRQILEHPTSKA